MIATLTHERDRMTDRIRFLTCNRDAIGEYLDAVLDCNRADAEVAAPAELSSDG